MTTDNLNHELEFYETIKDRLVAAGNTGKYVVIGDGADLGIWDTYEDALSAGYNHFGLTKRFLIKKIEGIEGLLFFSREIIGCPA